MKKILLTSVLIGTVTLGSAFAARDRADVTVQSRDAAGVPTFVKGDLGTLGTDVVGSIAAHAELFQAVGTERFTTRSVVADDLGQTHIRLQQTINGLPVVGGELIVHADASGKIFAINGHFVPDRGLDRTPAAPGAKMILRAAEMAGIADFKAATDAELVYFADGRVAALAWAMTLQYVDGAGNEQLDRVFADARTGVMLGKDALYKYAKNRRTHDANNGTSLPGTLRRTEGSGNIGDAALDAAHNYAGVTYDYYSTVHGRDSYDDNGATLTSTVHYSNNYNNAFWNGSQMVYGDGDGTTFAPLSQSLDVDAHELTHAVTERTANLVYAKESGALNEAWSDILGAATEAWNDGSVSADTWRLGEDIYTPNGSSTDALRYMDDPTADGYSKDYYPERLYPGSCTPNPNTNDNCGVHGNSGIANLAFVLLVEGGTHPRGKTSVNVPSIGIAKAERIFYRALVTYMSANTNFEGARNATAQAADDLYGQSDVDAIHDAWNAVGVPGGPVVVNELENGVPVSGLSGSTGNEQRWTMAVPSGASNLSFQISGGSGDADLYVRFGSAPTTSSYDCRPYLNGNNETCSFSSPSTGTYHVMLRAYSTYSGVTLVGSYTGGGPNDPPTANFSFSTNDLTANFTDTSTDSDGTIASRSWNFGDGGTSSATNPSRTYASAGTYTVTLTVTDNDGDSDSISKNVTVTDPPNVPPTANFSFSTSDLTATFTNTSSDPDGTIVSRSWNFGDGGTSTANNPSRTYASAGTYTVTLTVTDNDGDSDSISKNVTVTDPPTGGCSGDLYTGSLSNGGYQYQPNGTYYYAGSGNHSGVLDGPSGTDFDLRLWKWTGRWSTVASSLTSSSHEEISYNGSSGYYVWRVNSYSGSGSYTLCLDTP